MIPANIHQIYLTGELPAALRRNVDTIVDRNKGWHHTLYDEASAQSFIAEHYDARVLRAYNRIDPLYGAARADLLRQLVIYELGGVYLDIKSYTEVPLSDIVRDDDQYLLSQWTDNGPGQERAGFGLHPDLAHIDGGEYQTFHVIANRKHPFTKAVIDRIVKNVEDYRPWHSVGSMGVLRTTGPIAYTLAIHPILHRHPHRIIDYKSSGIVYSIEYEHQSVFRNHYSNLSGPITRMGWAGERMSSFFVGARRQAGKLKARFR